MRALMPCSYLSVRLREAGRLVDPAPLAESADRGAQRLTAIRQRVGASVVAERQPDEDASGLELPRAGGEHVRADAQVALEIAVALRSIEQLLDDKERPPCSDDIECGSEATRIVESAGASSRTVSGYAGHSSGASVRAALRSRAH